MGLQTLEVSLLIFKSEHIFSFNMKRIVFKNWEGHLDSSGLDAKRVLGHRITIRSLRGDHTAALPIFTLPPGGSDVSTAGEGNLSNGCTSSGDSAATRFLAAMRMRSTCADKGQPVIQFTLTGPDSPTLPVGECRPRRESACHRVSLQETTAGACQRPAGARQGGFLKEDALACRTPRICHATVWAVIVIMTNRTREQMRFCRRR